MPLVRVAKVLLQHTLTFLSIPDRLAAARTCVTLHHAADAPFVWTETIALQAHWQHAQPPQFQCMLHTVARAFETTANCSPREAHLLDVRTMDDAQRLEHVDDAFSLRLTPTETKKLRRGQCPWNYVDERLPASLSRCVPHFPHLGLLRHAPVTLRLLMDDVPRNPVLILTVISDLAARIRGVAVHLFDHYPARQHRPNGCAQANAVLTHLTALHALGGLPHLRAFALHGYVATTQENELVAWLRQARRVLYTLGLSRLSITTQNDKLSQAIADCTQLRTLVAQSSYHSACTVLQALHMQHERGRITICRVDLAYVAFMWEEWRKLQAVLHQLHVVRLSLNKFSPRNTCIDILRVLAKTLRQPTAALRAVCITTPDHGALPRALYCDLADALQCAYARHHRSAHELGKQPDFPPHWDGRLLDVEYDDNEFYTLDVEEAGR